METYGEETAQDILPYLRMITFGNLYGNTFDALLSRLAGKPAPGSSLWSELGVLFGVFVLVPLELLRRLGGKPPQEQTRRGDQSPASAPGSRLEADSEPASRSTL